MILYCRCISNAPTLGTILFLFFCLSSFNLLSGYNSLNGIVTTNFGQSNFSLKYAQLRQEAKAAYDAKQYQIALNKYLETREYAHNIGQHAENECLEQIAKCYKHLSQYAYALEYFYILLDHLPDQQNLRRGKVLSHISSIYTDIGNYAKAYESLLNSLEIFEINKDTTYICKAKYDLGNLDFYRQKYPEALIHFKDVMTLLQSSQHESKSFKFAYLAALGSTYEKLGQFEQALHYNETSLQIAIELNDLQSMAYAHQNLGTTYLGTANYDFAMNHLNEAVELFAENDDLKGMAISHNYLGTLYGEVQNYFRAIFHFEEALRLSKQIKALQQVVDANKGLANCYEKLGEHQRSNDYLRTSYALKDSLINEKSVERMAQKRSEFDLQKKERELQINAALLKNSKEFNRKIQLFYVATTVLLLIILIFSLLHYILKKKQAAQLSEKNLQIEAQYEALEKVNLELQRKNEYIAAQNDQLEIYNQSLKEKSSQISIQNKQLEIVNEELRQYAFVASHDLKEPLRTINSFTTIIQNTVGKDFDEKSNGYFKYIISATDRMKKMLEDLLDFSKIDKGEGMFTNFSLGDVLKEVVGYLDGKIVETQATVKVDYPSLPVVHAFETHLFQLFQNLIANALKFSKKDIPPQISIEGKEEGEFYILTIKDNGIGMPADAQDRIFKMFSRLHKDTHEGTGIGLATCKKIVAQYHGHISVDSQVGIGSTFHIHLPKQVLVQEEMMVQ